MAADGEGGALVIWQTSNGHEYDFHGQQLDNTGGAAGGIFTVLETAGSQERPALAAGDGNLFLLAWQDERNGNWDIYGQRFQYLQAAFTATPASGDPPLEVQFTDTSTPADIADQWLWSFGDGGTSMSQHPVYTYTQSGSYMVTLAITDTYSGESDMLVYCFRYTESAPKRVYCPKRSRLCYKRRNDFPDTCSVVTVTAAPLSII